MSKKVIVKPTDLNFEFYQVCNDNDFPGCCSITVIGDFPSDDSLPHLLEYTIKDRGDYGAEDYVFPTLAQAKPAMLSELVNKIEDLEQRTNFIVLSDKQKFSQEATLKAGYKKVGTYKGHEGIITVFQKGLTLARR